jgi:hypothetical protein
MPLNEQQRITVADWAKEGCSLSEIQRRLAQQFNITMTYIDVRLLVIEIGASIKEQPKPAKPADLKPEPAAAPLDEEDAMPGLEPEPAAGGLSVEIDRVVRAGAVISGTVVFSDGVRASWALDQSGRLALNAGNQKDYRPSQADAQAFQQAVVKELRKHGYG